MNSQCGLIELVRQLIEAENEHGEAGIAKAEPILAGNFAQITRARGKEQNRIDLLNEIENPPNPQLNEIENPPNPQLRRSLDEQEKWERCSGDLGVARTIVWVTDLANAQAAPLRFRNTHVFERQGEKWFCIAWQVTKLA